jgi:hypothetical protein
MSTVRVQGKREPHMGPQRSHHWIRERAGWLPVADPGGGVSFSSASNIQSLIDGNASNTVFVASAMGTYTNFRGIVYGNKKPRFWFPGHASSYSIQGAGSLNEVGMNGNTNGLEIHGGTWKLYATSGSTFGGPMVAVGPSVIQDAIFTLNQQNGLALQGTTEGAVYLISRCSFITNGRYGITANNGGFGVRYTPTLEFCLLEDNNSNLNDPGSDAGAMKFNHTDGFEMASCWSKGNHGFGAWADGDNRNLHWHDNVVENNIGFAPIPGAGGMFVEISEGGAVIENNYATGNGDSTDANYPFNAVQIIVSCSPSDGTGPNPFAGRSEIRYNDVDTSDFRSPIVLYNHSSHIDSLRTRNWYVHHNRMTMRGATGQSRAGLSDQCTPSSSKEGDIGTSPGSPGLCLFDFNEYHVADINGSYWNHDTSSETPGARTWAQFQAAGHEANGTRVAL